MRRPVMVAAHALVGERGQMCVEMAVLLPVTLVIALAVLNLARYAELCARFDRVALDAVVACGASPSGAGDASSSKGRIVICTVKGDIHDIGKNIVRMLLENYGYDVVDLGRDVDPQLVVDAVVRDHVQLCGLSALMTSTVPAMSETIALLHEKAPWCRVMVGGAVLTPEYAKMVGADYYAKDATASAKIAAEVLGQR